ncbi:MAG TPA: cytochrome c maturation protein CcmE [Sneathiellales bacterium]|jgi:cytochrome c-type biogenesis protein CcmE|nr:cytochrome c maturation protein CcmE [Sneathiellales bacterium]
MKPKRRRLIFVIVAVTVLGAAATLVLTAFDENLVFFLTPSELAIRDVDPGRRFRLGGLVEEGSVEKVDDGIETRFRVTDLSAAVPVRYRGLLPDLFREGQGVVTEGAMGLDGVFVASNVLAKHDENYMPAEVAEALKKSGKWQGDKGRNAPDNW